MQLPLAWKPSEDDQCLHGWPEVIVCELTAFQCTSKQNIWKIKADKNSAHSTLDRTCNHGECWVLSAFFVLK